MYWNRLNDVLRARYGTKVYKLALSSGCSCPNRDGTLGTGGCIFCSAGGSGDFAADAALSITDQIESQISILSQKRPIHKYIAYFQAYTYTYDRSQKRKKRDKYEIGLSSVRGGNIVGEHEVIFAGQDEVIEFKHTAYSKAVFAKGAVEAAKFLKGKPAGHYDMADVIAAK